MIDQEKISIVKEIITDETLTIEEQLDLLIDHEIDLEDIFDIAITM